MTTAELQSPARLAGVVYADRPRADDPAELYHEASKLSESTAARELAGVARLADSRELRRVTAAATLRHPELPLRPLPQPEALQRPLGAAIAGRRSARRFGRGPISAATLAALLEAAYGVTGSLDDADGWTQPLRAAPSGGALYPLDLFVAVHAVTDVPAGLYRFEPLEHGLEEIGVVDHLPAATAYPALAEAAAATVVIAATFWRARFKYGLRAYRFALFEAGHVAQNLLLAATSLELAAVPLGGFYDRRLDDALGLDGVDRSSLYVVCVGAPEAGG